jgi:MoaA/NifB/PqqE/SkfB family radical SAM enzyme
MDRTDVVGNLYGWSVKKKQPPVNVELHPTYKCNSKCIFCDQRRGLYDYSNSMPREKWLQLIEELHNIGTKKIQISGGGEPMMVPNITMGMIKLVKNHGMEGKINTNGTLWNKRDLRILVDVDWDKIIFSIHGHNKRSHDMLTGKRGMFRKAIANIKYLNKIKQKFEKKKPIIEINTVITNKNYNYLPDLVYLSKKIGVNSITAEPVFITLKSVKKLKLNKKQSKEFNKILKNAAKIADCYNIEHNFNSLLRIDNFNKSGNMKDIIYNNEVKKNCFEDLVCFEPWYFPKIGPNGEFGPCCNYPYLNSHINIRNKIFSEVWFGKKMNRFRDSLINREFNEVCENCTFTRVAINRELKEQLIKYKNSMENYKK